MGKEQHINQIEIRMDNGEKRILSFIDLRAAIDSI